MSETLTNTDRASQPPSQLSVPTGQFPALIEGILPWQSVNLFSGASGVGKTALKAEWIARLLRGQTILGRPTQRPSGVYYLAADRPWVETYSEAFEAAKVDPREMVVYCLLDDPLYDPRKLKEKEFSAFNFLADCLKRLKPTPGSLLCIDPMAPLYIQGDQNHAKDVAVSLHWIRKLTQLYQCTTICDTNVTKIKIGEGFEDIFDAFSGSAAFRAYADTLFIFRADTDNDAGPRTLHWKVRRAAPGKFTFQFDPETRLFVPFTGLQDEGSTEATDRPSQLLKLIPEAGSIDADVLVEQAIEKFHISRATVYRDIKVLKKRLLVIDDLYGAMARRKRS